MVKLTTARWYTPQSISIDEKGIDPDVAVYLTDEDYRTQNDTQLKTAEKILKDMIEKNMSIQDVIQEYNK